MSEDPTNIIKNDEPATRVEGRGGAAGAAPTIRFSCGNGHSIVVPAKLAGKRGTCSRCGAPVVIPLADEREATAETSEESPPALDSQEEPAMPVAPAMPAEADDAIPDFSKLGGDLAAEEEQEAATADGPASLEDFEGLDAAEPDGAFEAAPGFAGEAAGPEAGDHPTAVLVAKLFTEIDHGGEVELHLKSGQVIFPRFFDYEWSRGTLGLFAHEDKATGTITLMAVAWEAVERVIVRKVKGLPDGMFEGP